MLDKWNRPARPGQAGLWSTLERTGWPITHHLQPDARLTCNELLVLNNWDVLIETRKIKKLGPGNADLTDVGALPVIEAAPRGQDKHPLLSLQQGLQQGGHADVDIPTEVEAFRRVDIIQKVSGRRKRT